MPIYTEITDGELPFRVQIKHNSEKAPLVGAGMSPAGAIMAALSVGGIIPAGMRDRKAASSHLFWNYEASKDWLTLIQILEKDDFAFNRP